MVTDNGIKEDRLADVGFLVAYAEFIDPKGHYWNMFQFQWDQRADSTWLLSFTYKLPFTMHVLKNQVPS